MTQMRVRTYHCQREGRVPYWMKTSFKILQYTIAIDICPMRFFGRNWCSYSSYHDSYQHMSAFVCDSTLYLSMSVAQSPRDM
jgi:hypothetical protein